MFPIAKRSGFSLAELMVAASVLMLLLLMVHHVVTSSSQIISSSGSGAASTSAARFALDCIANDLACQVRRAELPFTIISQPGNDEVRFFSAVPSVSPSGDDARGLALVAYRVTANGLERAANGTSWSGTGTALAFADPTAAQTIPSPAGDDFDRAAPAIFRLEIAIIDINGNLLASAPGTPEAFRKNVAAIVISVAAMDVDARRKISNASSALKRLAGKFGDAQDGTAPADTWAKQLDDIQNLSQETGIPVKALSTIKILKRICYVR